MKLENWKKRNDLSYIKLGEVLGISTTSVYNLLSDGYKPSDRLIKRIEQATNGAVKRRDFNVPRRQRCPTCNKLLLCRNKKKRQKPKFLPPNNFTNI